MQAGDAGGAGARCRAGQWWPRPLGGLLPGLHGSPEPACLGLWHPLPVRHVQAGERKGGILVPCLHF
eukprot:1008301-Pelagomonas_calceolata.AAC.14